MTATAGSVMPNLEAPEGRRIGQRRFGMLFDVSTQLALPDGFHERAHFVFFARDQKLDAAIAQIPHRTGDIESFRYLPHGIAKTNALDVSFVEDLDRSDHATRRLIRHSAGGNRFRYYCYGSGAGAGKSASGNCSGGGTRRGSFELRLNCSLAESLVCGAIGSAGGI